MKRFFTILTLGFISGPQLLWAIPTTINYQGTLKEKGLPANGTKTIAFQLTSQDASTPYSATITKSLTVVNGLFSTQLDFQLLPTFTWESITPYIQVSIGGQTLSPTEPLNATVYATVSGSIVDGAITPAKVVNGYGLVPSGMIAIFANTCPLGWIVFTPLQGKFPVGADPNNPSQFTVGQSSGSLTHSHTILPDGSHNHSGQTTAATRGGTQLVTTPAGAPAGEYLEDVANQSLERSSPHSHGIPPDGSHNHGGTTGFTSSLPPYLGVVFCQKQ